MTMATAASMMTNTMATAAAAVSMTTKTMVTAPAVSMTTKTTVTAAAAVSMTTNTISTAVDDKDDGCCTAARFVSATLLLFAYNTSEEVHSGFTWEMLNITII